MDADVNTVVDTGLDEGIARFLANKEGSDSQIFFRDVQEKAAAELSAYGARLLEELAKCNITIPPAIQLHSPDEGHVLALGDHPAKQQVSELINADTVLLKWFKEVEVLHVVMRHIELRRADQPATCQHFNLGITSLGCIAFFTEA